MQKMKAYVRTSAQNQHVELAEVAIPDINDDEVLVKVEAFGVGIHDRYFIPNDAIFPFPIGTEAAGVITKTGGNVTPFQVQDRVILTSALQPKGGCWAEYVAVSQGSLMTLPPEMDFTTGAVIPVAGGAALESMRSLDLQAGDTLFVAGASGAIGTLVIQLAVAQGIRVAGSASPQNHEYMLSLGAETAVSYTDPTWKQQVKQWQPGGVSAALAIQPGTIEDSMDVVQDGGKVVAVSGDQAPSRRNIAVSHMQHHADTRPLLVQLISDIATGQIRVVTEQIYPFAQALAALEKTESRHARGKVVVSLADA
ncbi:MAG: NADP-dependent oxidoreductase [Chloroflexi bacterium]|nr:NADP-dependent oxidoreductase [Chloroflexota bacterium]